MTGPKPESTVPETPDAGIVLVYAPGVTPRTVKVTWQLPSVGTVKPLAENAVEPGTALKLGVPPQVVLTFAGDAICTSRAAVDPKIGESTIEVPVTGAKLLLIKVNVTTAVVP